MREIKFRAWDKNRKEMLYSDTTDPNKLLIKWDFRNNHWIAVRTKDGIVVGKANSLLMQYTGLKDKNGEEIYEGDIVKLDDYTGYYVITWDKRGGYRLQHYRDTSWGFWLATFESHEMEIVGNIYEKKIKEVKIK